MKTLLLTLMLAFCTAGFAQQTPSDQYKKEYEKFLELTGVSASFPKIIDQAFAAMPQDMTEKEKEKIAAIREVFATESIQELLNEMLPVYEKCLSLDDLKAINTFYESTAGRNFIASQQKMIPEMMPIVQKWGARLAEKLSQAMKK